MKLQLREEWFEKNITPDEEFEVGVGAKSEIHTAPSSAAPQSDATAASGPTPDCFPRSG